MNNHLVLPATSEPLPLEQAKNHLRVSHDDDDDLIAGLITVSREYVERDTGRPLLSQTYIAYGACFSAHEILLSPNLQSVNWIKFLDKEEKWITLDKSEYMVSRHQLLGMVTPVDSFWPHTFHHPESVQIEFLAGYGDDPSAVPQIIKQAMLLIIGHLYENREETTELNIRQLPFAVKTLLNSYQIPVVM